MPFPEPKPALPEKPDLVSASHHLLALLSEVHNYPSLYLNRRVLRRAIARYETVWHRVLAAVPAAQRLALVPPIDIHWVWLCHMLCPLAYIDDSKRIWEQVTGQSDIVVNHQLLGGSAVRRGMRKARRVWERVEKDELFDTTHQLAQAPLKDDAGDEEMEGVKHSSLISYDIIAAASRQMAFHYQVCVLPHYRSPVFLSAAADRYAGFLALQRARPTEVWVPTFDIDLVWHAHQAHPVEYAHCTAALLGRVLAHDDSLNGREEGSDLIQRWNATKAAWTELFGTSVGRHGAMWRGNVSGEEMAVKAELECEVAKVESRLAPLASSRRGLRRPQLQLCVRLRFPQVARPDMAEMSSRVAWVHATHMESRRQPAACKVGLLPVERWACLGSELTCRVQHALLANEAGIAYDYVSQLDIFAGVKQSTHEALPLASAHTPLLQSVCQVPDEFVHDRVLATAPGERVLLLRLCGDDFALLAARGVGGLTRLRIWFLAAGTPDRWQTAKRVVSKTWPQTYRVSVPVVSAGGGGGSCRWADVSFDVFDGTVLADSPEVVVPAFLVAMSAAMLYVGIQTRFPTDGGNADPTGVSSKTNFEMLQAAGGEVVRDGRLEGIREMLRRASDTKPSA